jgi:hypothetical protein
MKRGGTRTSPEALASEEHLFAASQRLQSEVDAFRIRQKAVKAADEASSRELSELRPGARQRRESASCSP